MTFYYRKQDDSPVADATCYNWMHCNSKVEFKELIIKETEGFYWLFFVAKSFENIKNSKDKDWEFKEGTKLRVKIARKPYEQYDFKEKKNITVEPALVEQYYCKLIEERNLVDKCLKGDLMLGRHDAAASLLTKKNGKGEDLPEQVLAWIFQQMHSFTTVENPIHLSESDLVIPEKKGNGFQRKSVTEKDKLNSRVEWILEQVKREIRHFDGETLWDLSPTAMEKNPKLTPDDMSEILHMTDFLMTIIK